MIDEKESQHRESDSDFRCVDEQVNEIDEHTAVDEIESHHREVDSDLAQCINKQANKTDELDKESDLP